MKKALSILESVLILAVVTVIAVSVTNNYAKQMHSLGEKTLQVTPRSNN